MPEDRQAGLVRILFDCLKRYGIVESAVRRVNPGFCVRLCKASEISENFFCTRMKHVASCPLMERFICRCLPAGLFAAMEKLLQFLVA